MTIGTLKPFGTVFANFDSIDLTTADNVRINFKTSPVSRLGLRIIGLPHIGLRLRGRKIMSNIPPKVTRAFDAGCGTGVYSFSLAKRVKQIDSIDISKEKIAQAKKTNIFKNINFQQGDLCKLKFKDDTFDLVICSDVLEHIKNDEKAFSELFRVTKQNGTMLITVPFDSKKNRVDYKRFEHERAGYRVEDVEKMCAQNGLKLVKYSGYSYPIADYLSNLSYRFIENKALLGILFYPLYFSCLIADSFFKSEPNGIFFKIIKP